MIDFILRHSFEIIISCLFVYVKWLVPNGKKKNKKMLNLAISKMIYK